MPSSAMPSSARGSKASKGIRSAEAIYVGTPASVADRPVLDTSYDYCLTVIVTDVAAHDTYQADPLHQTFIQNVYKTCWKQVKVYD